MRISDLVYKLAFAGLAAAVLAGCKKENGIDNNTVIKKPYSLYIGDADGSILNTNDGDSYRTLHTTDGYPARAIVTSGSNVLFLKSNVHLSTDNGRNFNPTYFMATPIAQWQPVVLDVPSHGRIYIGSFDPAGKGVAYSEDNGKKWVVDNSWDPDVIGGGISSFTQVSGGGLYAYNGDSLYKKNDKNDPWTHINSTDLPDGFNYLSHFNNTLILTDRLGANGVSYSNDEGMTWNPYTGLPETGLRATAAPFEQVLLVGTDSNGIYRLQNDAFVPSNNGLDTKTTVYSIVGKDDLYKNDSRRRYIYIATNKGLYRSEDLGQNWYLVKGGRYQAVY